MQNKNSSTLAAKIFNKSFLIAALSVAAIVLYLILRFFFGFEEKIFHIPLVVSIVLGGTLLIWDLLKSVWNLEFSSDLLAGISIVTALLLGEYLAATLVILMLSGGNALENYALRNASSVLSALAKRLPSTAHKKIDSRLQEITLSEICIGDSIVVFPHDVCPVDGVVIEGHGVMDESYLTGEPFQITKTIGSATLSGAINGESVLTIRATKLASDSRYAKIMAVMHESEQQRPRIRRLSDRLGAWYTPLALILAGLAWLISGDSIRFLSVLVIATPCPLLIAIPVSIIGSISLCARRSIIVKSPAVLEQIATCRTAIFDKTGTLTYGEPSLIEQLVVPGVDRNQILSMAASLERYSKHPLASAVSQAASTAGLFIPTATEASEEPGKGLKGTILGHQLLITSRKKIIDENVPGVENLPEAKEGLECVFVLDGNYVATYRFHDAPRKESPTFIGHLGPKHHFSRVMIISGDREEEVRYLADEVGIKEIYARKSPEEKVSIVREETAHAKTLYVGDGINDAPAMMAATVGIAIGQNSDVTSEAADIVVLDNSLRRVDEFFHIGRRMYSIALQSAIGGMGLSLAGMILAACGYMSPVQGAIAQEVIDVFAVLNALRAASLPNNLSDF